MMGPKGEKVCLISCSGSGKQRGNIRSDPLRLLITGDADAAATCQSRADAAAVHRAVAGAGLVHHVVKAQLLGVACTQRTGELLSGARGVVRPAPRPPARLRTFVGGLRGRGLSRGPVGSDLSAS